MFWATLFYILVFLFVVALAICWLSNLFGLPGNWLIVLLVAGWGFFTDAESAWNIGWWPIVGIVALAGIGELIEFFASVFGTRKFGGSKRAATCSVIGSIVGGLMGGIIGLPIPIPLVGMIIGSVLFACAGAWIGATIGEKWEGSEMDKSLKVGGAAAAGRFVGTMGKIAIGSAMLVASIFSLFF